MDEIHFRMASIGLAGRPGSPQEVADLFTAAYRPLPMVEGLDNSAEISLAETIAIRARGMEDVQTTTQYAVNMLQSPWKGGWATDDQVRAIAIVLSIPGEAQAVIGRTIELAQTYTYYNLAAAALLTSSEAKWAMGGGRAEPGPGSGPDQAPSADPLSVYVDNYQRLYTAHPSPEVPVIASILTVSGLPAQKAFDRFEKAFNVLENYNGGQMQVPAAMVAIMPFGVDECLDNIRMASASVIKNKMTLGGVENMSLGLKMALHSSIMASSQAYAGSEYAPLATPVPSMMAIAGLSAAAALAIGAGLLAFHETYLHRKAVSDHTFHPVHRAYMYG